MSNENGKTPPAGGLKILITGGAGFMGKKLTSKLLETGTVSCRGVEQTIDTIVLADVVEPTRPDEKETNGDSSSMIKVETVKADLSKKDDITALIAGTPDIIYHLAAIVSGDAEQNFDLGYAINMDGTRSLLEAIRSTGGDDGKEEYTPRLVFASSAAVYGAPTPDPIPDTFHLTPHTSYGTQKAICELLVSDYTRKGFVDGISIRFPTISVRPGKPNKAASSFLSGIIREPLSGVEAICPVDRTVKHPVASPRKAVDYLLHATSLNEEDFKDGGGRAINMPSITVSVGEMLDALEAIAGKEVADLVKIEKDDFVQGIISNWQFVFENKRAKELGFVGDACFKDIVQAHIDDELGGAVHKAKKQDVKE